MQYNFEYFSHLAKESIAILDKLPIEKTPQPLDYVLNKMKTEIDVTREEYIGTLSAIEHSINENVNNTCAQGLNTIGMLTDRFTILLIREWCIRNKGIPDAEKADKLFNTQTKEIMQAMAEVRPGYSSLNSKITQIKANAKADNWDEAYYGLFTTNLLLWESQEVLYIKDIQSLPTEEIRNYIKWFSFGNILRNEYIELCEQLYWLAT